MACTEPQATDSGSAFGFALDSPNFAHLRPESGQLISTPCQVDYANSTRTPKLRGSVGRNPSPGSLLSPPSPQGRGLKSIIDDGPLPWGEGGPQPALSSAGAGRVRGYLP